MECKICEGTVFGGFGGEKAVRKVDSLVHMPVEEYVGVSEKE